MVPESQAPVGWSPPGSAAFASTQAATQPTSAWASQPTAAWASQPTSAWASASGSWGSPPNPAWAPPDEAALRRFATGLFRGQAALTTLERVAKVPPRLGIVAETGGRGDVWRAQFDDALATRIYLNGRTGEFVTSRNEAWVWYDLSLIHI